MTQKAKHYLKEKFEQKSDTFTIANPRREGGIIGSLVGLGYVERKGVNEYEITSQGLEWIRGEEKGEL